MQQQAAGATPTGLRSNNVLKAARNLFCPIPLLDIKCLSRVGEESFLAITDERNDAKSQAKTHFCKADRHHLSLLLRRTSIQIQRRALAAEDRVSGPFTSYDRNRDGKLSVDEFRDSELFKRVDSNGDGLITLSEAKLAADQGVFKDQELPEPLSEAPLNESERKATTSGRGGLGRF